jgi:hypothetical protein
MTAAMLASVLAALVLSFVAIFQVLLAIGLPLGEAAGAEHTACCRPTFELPALCHPYCWVSLYGSCSLESI